MHNRRAFLRSLGAGTTSLLLTHSNVETFASTDKRFSAYRGARPNFLFILTDDQRHDAMGCAGNRLIRTPTIDALAARGTRFENAFVTLSICSPSRAACLTGRYGSATGVTRVPGTLNADERTVAHFLRDAGYRTGMVGKWHLGNSPEDCGFDSASYFESNGPYYGRRVVEGGRQATTDAYVEQYNADRAGRFVREAAEAGEPFFLFYCTQVPHMNHEFDWPARAETLALYDEREMPVPETWQDDLEGKPPYLKSGRNRKQALQYGYDHEQCIRTHIQKYYAAITEMDAALAQVFKTLDDVGLHDDTYVFFMGDNGWLMGEHGFTSKVLPYEESMRVPMIVAGPGINATVDRHLVLNVDLAPTLLELAGLPLPEKMHGTSLVPLLRGSRVEWRSSFLYEAPTPSLGSWPLVAVRTERWKYIQTFDKDEPTCLAFEELYHLHRDPHEMRNLAGHSRQAKRKAKFQKELAHLRDVLRA